MSPQHPGRLAIAHLLATALVLAGLPATEAAGAAEAQASLAGRVVGVDGAFAAGCHVFLIDENGHAAAQAATDARGAFAFTSVTPGRYGLGVADARGRHAPVAGPPIALAAGVAVRRDLKLVEAGSPRGSSSAPPIDPSVGSWWTSLSAPGKIWVVLAIVVAGTFLYEAVTREPDEQPASPV